MVKTVFIFGGRIRSLQLDSSFNGSQFMVEWKRGENTGRSDTAACSNGEVVFQSAPIRFLTHLERRDPGSPWKTKLLTLHIIKHGARQERISKTEIHINELLPSNPNPLDCSSHIKGGLHKFMLGRIIYDADIIPEAGRGSVVVSVPPAAPSSPPPSAAFNSQHKHSLEAQVAALNEELEMVRTTSAIDLSKLEQECVELRDRLELKTQECERLKTGTQPQGGREASSGAEAFQEVVEDQQKVIEELQRENEALRKRVHELEGQFASYGGKPSPSPPPASEPAFVWFEAQPSTDADGPWAPFTPADVSANSQFGQAVPEDEPSFTLGQESSNQPAIHVQAKTDWDDDVCLGHLPPQDGEDLDTPKQPQSTDFDDLFAGGASGVCPSNTAEVAAPGAASSLFQDPFAAPMDTPVPAPPPPPPSATPYERWQEACQEDEVTRWCPTCEGTSQTLISDDYITVTFEYTNKPEMIIAGRLKLTAQTNPLEDVVANLNFAERKEFSVLCPSATSGTPTEVVEGFKENMMFRVDKNFSSEVAAGETTEWLFDLKLGRPTLRRMQVILSFRSTGRQFEAVTNLPITFISFAKPVFARMPVDKTAFDELEKGLHKAPPVSVDVSNNPAAVLEAYKEILERCLHYTVFEEVCDGTTVLRACSSFEDRIVVLVTVEADSGSRTVSVRSASNNADAAKCAQYVVLSFLVP